WHCAIHAYVLMTNHVHLLLQPGEAVADLGCFMKALSARTTRYFNRQEGRSGTLWESRYKSSPVQTEQYLLACCRYIELNPVRARMVGHPGEYRWSSYTARMGGVGHEWLDPDPMYQALGDDETTRRSRYLKFLEEAIPSGEWELIRESVKRGQLTGNTRFAEAVEQIIGRRIARRGPGRPPKDEPEVG
ncbi:MAG TPA: transposase, partial [Gallionella sp.]|nr:transposase [Gallionella sp.]